MDVVAVLDELAHELDVGRVDLLRVGQDLGDVDGDANLKRRGIKESSGRICYCDRVYD